MTLPPSKYIEAAKCSMNQFQAEIIKVFKGYKLAGQAKAESETGCLLLKGIQAEKINANKDFLLDKTNLSFEPVCAKISNAAQRITI